jgi:glycerol-3-phosphate cytidylyltransferase
VIIGYTTGVFDMFHVGHLNLLARAREQCDRLIVGVSTDDVVLDYKKHAPIVPYAERVAIVKAIRYVDEVVPQTSMDKFAAWEKLRFNRLFHGNDWKGSAMYNEVEAKLKAVGVEVVYFPYTQGTSSTLLAERLRGWREESKR